jgi:hypothetical protein
VGWKEGQDALGYLQQKLLKVSAVGMFRGESFAGAPMVVADRPEGAASLDLREGGRERGREGGREEGGREGGREGRHVKSRIRVFKS